MDSLAVKLLRSSSLKTFVFGAYPLKKLYVEVSENNPESQVFGPFQADSRMIHICFGQNVPDLDVPGAPSSLHDIRITPGFAKCATNYILKLKVPKAHFTKPTGVVCHSIKNSRTSDTKKIVHPIALSVHFIENQVAASLHCQ